MKKVIIAILIIMFGLPIAILGLALIADLASIGYEAVRSNWLTALMAVTCIVVLINQFKKDS